MRARLALCAVVAAGTSFPVGFATPACAGEGGSAALVVDTGQAEYRYCVAIPDGDVSGIDVIELAGRQHGLTYRLGFGGKAVCMLAGVGAESDDCFEKYPEFWGYWRGNADGGWSWSSSGADSTTVEDGDVEGWSWGSGSDGSSHQQPPATQFSDVCAASSSGADRGRRDRDSQRSAGGGRGDLRSDSPRRARSRSARLRNSPDPVPPSSTGERPPNASRDVNRSDAGQEESGGDAVPPAASAGVPRTEGSPGSEARDEVAASTSSGRSPVTVPALALGATTLLVGAGLVVGRRRRAG